MDELILLGLLILAAIVASPIMALVALSRSRQARDEVALLKKQIDVLHKQLAQDQPVTKQSAEQFAQPSTQQSFEQPVVQPTKSEVSPVDELMTQTSPLRSDDRLPPIVHVPSAKSHIEKPQVNPEIAPLAEKAAAPATPSSNSSIQKNVPQQKESSPDLFSGLISWLVKGNPVAKLGILLLFFGLAYLLKYTIDRDMFPIELRLASAALISIVLLGVGWRLRHKQPLYALILQGGAIGVLYITVFAAFRLYLLLPHMFAFGLMIVICAASVGLAVLQRTVSLAMLASIGGYLSPILLSTGSANHIGLFSYYLLISCGILAVSVWQSWRVLNLLGFIFTFGVATLWGLEHYRPEHYLSCQLFLIANLILFSLLAELFAVKNRVQQHMAIDGTLIFGPSLIGFAMQYAITSHWEFGPAFSALGFGLIYLIITWATLRRFPQDGKRIAIGYLALGGSFVTLAIPLALSAQWTALAWALEGLGILWFGLLQNQRRLSWSGSALLVLALVAQFVAYADYHLDISPLFVLPVLFLCFIIGGALWRHYKPENSPWQVLSLSMLVVGIMLWCWWLADTPIYLYGQSYQVESALWSLFGLSLSVWIWRRVGQYLNWQEFKQTVWLLWPTSVWILLAQLADASHPLALGWINLIWIVVIASAILLLIKDAPTLLSDMLEKGAHLLLFWLVLALVGSEIAWRIDQLSWGMNEWRFYLQVCSLSIVILLLWIVERRQIWPLNDYSSIYWFGCIPIALALIALLLTGNMMDGQMVSWTYIPLINPLEEAAMFGILMLAVWLRRIIFQLKDSISNLDQLIPWIVWGLAAWWLNGSLLRALAYYADIAWWFDLLWASRLIQATFAIVWTLAALICMVYSAKAGRRMVWFAGAAVLGIVILKLFLIDSVQGGGLARAVAFLGVAGLLLVVGYFSPLPPRQPVEKEEQS